MSNSIEKLAENFSKLPGIGRKQAKRFVYFILKNEDSYTQELLKNIEEVKKTVKACPRCFLFHSENSDLCKICNSNKTDKKTMLVVERDEDIENIAKTGVFSGRYFILGGLLKAVSGKGNFIREKEIISEIDRSSKEDGLQEIIIALSVNPDGELTTNHLIKKIQPKINQTNIKVSVPGRGLSTGTELMYSDESTIKNAFDNRTSLD